MQALSVGLVGETELCEGRLQGEGQGKRGGG